MAYNQAMERPKRTRKAGRAVLQRVILVVGGLNAWWVALASAQQGARAPEETKPMVQWVCVVVFAGLAVAIACKNPKRTHQD